MKEFIYTLTDIQIHSQLKYMENEYFRNMHPKHLK